MTNELSDEWRCLQQQFEDYEKYSLWIKLVNILITLYLLVNPQPIAICLVGVLYVQDAIVKTMQSRMGERLIDIERAIEQHSTEPAYQLHRQWLAKRGGISALLMEYFRHCLKPTVIFPHLLLLAVLLFQCL
ncbi:hypothetical protein [Neptunicella sp. SCSIO 80796]|uniref:hypothetical protein n=1 Tax=Neptunicella plasticusilytica TaxID=3117012 RepID=UPI003A4D4FCA